jgi:hypothetical protein
MTGYIQFLTHLIGDYVLQSDWMALNKSRKTIPCLIHAAIYTFCFYLAGLIFEPISPLALLVIGITHFLIDRFPVIVKKLIWWKNTLLRPKLSINWTWTDCQETGLSPDRPDFIRWWLLIITDNILHLVINALAIGLL